MYLLSSSASMEQFAMESKARNAEEVCLPVPKHCRTKGIKTHKLKCASLAADESNKSRNATVQETRKVCRRLLHSLFAVVARDLLVNLARSRCHFISFVQPERNSKKFKILPSLRSKLSPEITSNDPRLLIFHV